MFIMLKFIPDTPFLHLVAMRCQKVEVHWTTPYKILLGWAWASPMHTGVTTLRTCVCTFACLLASVNDYCQNAASAWKKLGAKTIQVNARMHGNCWPWQRRAGYSQTNYAQYHNKNNGRKFIPEVHNRTILLFTLSMHYLHWACQKRYEFLTSGNHTKNGMSIIPIYGW